MSFDFDAAVSAPFRMQPGLRRLAAGVPHLTPLSPGSRHQREKLAVLSAFPELALQLRPGFDPQPALHALAAHAAVEHPQAFAWDGRTARALRLGTAVHGTEVQHESTGAFGLGDEIARCLRPLPPGWRLAGLLSLTFAEDLAIVDATDGSVPWMAVCLPSHWSPQDKVGLGFADLHAPVADGDTVRRAAPQLIRLVTGGEAWERFVWNITSHPRLHAHPRHIDPMRWPADMAATLPAGAWWRTERQTFLPVGGKAQAVFTIAVDCCPLNEAISSPARALALHDALASMSDAVLDYRALASVREPLLRWLRTVR